MRTGGRAIARNELATYNISKLRHFYLADGEVIQRYDLSGATLPQAREVEWVALADEGTFADFFAPVAADRRSLRRQLEEFSAVEVPLGRPIEDLKDRRRFIEAMVTVARILTRAVDELVDARLVPDLKRALQYVDTLSTGHGYGAAIFEFLEKEIRLSSRTSPTRPTSMRPVFSMSGIRACFRTWSVSLCSTIRESRPSLIRGEIRLRCLRMPRS